MHSCRSGSRPRRTPANFSRLIPLCIDLAAVTDAHRPLVGGKAASLAQLAAAGFRVPPGFVVTTEAYKRAVLRGPVASELVLAEHRLATTGAEGTWAELAPLRERIAAAPLPGELETELRARLASTFPGDPPLAVRSSGTKEDLEGSSFAGQYETVLDVRGADAVIDALRRCWASVWRTRVLQYAARRAGGAGGLEMAVVVQALVPAEVAGVLFTVNPLTGREEHALCESAFGLGEALVSGKVDPDRFVLEPATGQALERTIAGARPTLDDARLGELAGLAAAVQEHYGQPMDVEWALAGGAIHLLQARPITKLAFAPELGEWTTADLRDGGVASDVCSPFMASLYESVMEETLPRYFRELGLLREGEQADWMRTFFARPYWNLGETKRVLARLPGFDEAAFDRGLGIEVPPDRPSRRTPVTLLGLIRALPALRALSRYFKEQVATDRTWLTAFPEQRRAFELEPAALGALPADGFLERYRALLAVLFRRAESTYFFTIYVTNLAKQELQGPFERAARRCPGLDWLKLVGGLEDLSHLRPARDLHAIAARLHAAGRGVSEQEVREFSARWGYHGTKELDIRVPRWKDDPAAVRAMLEQALAGFDPTRDPATQAAAARQQYEAEKARALAALRWRPFLRRRFLRALELVRTYAWWREEMRDLSTHAYALVRTWTVEAARRLVAERRLVLEEDVWYLAFPEVLELLEGRLAPATARERVKAARRTCHSFRAFANPNEIGAGHGLAPALPGPAADGALRGIGGSPGRVEGTARVLLRLEEAGRVEKGAVLVTPFTDPGWTPLLGRVAAVVTETGGVLSHAAVISREYGIPAVLAVRGATRAIPDGARVVVDGTAGTVEVR